VEGIKLTVNPDVLDYIVDKAEEYKLGARGLRSICETMLTDAMFQLPSSNRKTFTLTLDYAREKIEHSTLSNLKVA
jgi:ATP-dependent Clp protease ATP-binding subunit ClpX